jgi:membrane-associated protease RseP (regulator of RpoE activity)
VASIAFYALASLLLYGASVPLTRISIALSVDVFVVAAVIVLLLRFGGDRVVAGDGVIVPSWRDGTRVAAFMALSVLLVAATVAARRGFSAPPPAPFTQFAFAGRWQHLSAAPRIGASRRLRVALEVTNQTNRLQRYRIVPTVTGRRWSRRDVTLAPGQRWLGSIAGVIARRPCSQRLTVALETVPDGRRVTQLALELRRPSSTCVRGSAG